MLRHIPGLPPNTPKRNALILLVYALLLTVLLGIVVGATQW